MVAHRDSTCMQQRDPDFATKGFPTGSFKDATSEKVDDENLSSGAFAWQMYIVKEVELD